jgi:hypothetical protein
LSAGIRARVDLRTYGAGHIRIAGSVELLGPLEVLGHCVGNSLLSTNACDGKTGEERRCCGNPKAKHSDLLKSDQRIKNLLPASWFPQNSNAEHQPY